ncbi:MAG: endonuclease/exonuclease/phosphatase family protein [Candidatus Cryosericum sp.]
MSRTRPVILSFIVLVLCCSLSGCIPPDTSTGPAATTIRILSYNVENAFDDHVDGTEYSDYGPSSNYYADHLWQVKIDHIREVLQAADEPQIVGLVEVENQRMATMILDGVLDLGYRDMAVTTGGSVTQCVLISSFLIQDVASLPTTSGVRDILSASVDVNGTPLHVLVNHWKSKDSGETESVRIKNARVARAEVDRLLKQDPAADIVLIGDFNSTENEHVATGKTTGINDVLRTTGDRTSMTAQGTRSLYDPWFEMPASQRGSEVYGAKWECLDHIIMSPGLFDRTGLSYDEGSFETFRAPFLLSYLRAADGRPVPNRWQESGNQHGSEGYSDHLPVIADFTIEPE